MAVYPESASEDDGHSGYVFGGIFTFIIILIVASLVIFFYRRRFKKLKTEHALYIASSDTGKPCDKCIKDVQNCVPFSICVFPKWLWFSIFPRTFHTLDTLLGHQTHIYALPELKRSQNSDYNLVPEEG